MQSLFGSRLYFLRHESESVLMTERHEHISACWRGYEPCGKHHAHTYNCGNGELRPSCPQYKPPPPTKNELISMLQFERDALIKHLTRVVAERDNALAKLDALVQAVRDHCTSIDAYAGDDYLTAERRRPRLALDTAIENAGKK